MIQFKIYVPKKFSDGKQRFVKDGEVYVYVTDDTSEIRMMEKLGYTGVEFKNTKVTAPASVITLTSEAPERVVQKQPDIFTEVETLQQAKLILVDKYGLAKNAHADKILSKAEELGVEFPNLKV